MYESKHPDEKDQIETLRNQVLEYASVIDRALDLHSQVCKDTAFHEALKSRKAADQVVLINAYRADYLRAFPDEIAALSRSTQRQSGPIPPLKLDPDQTLFASPSTQSPRPSDVSSRPSIIVPAPYSLPPLRVGPSSNGKVLPTIPTLVTPVTSPERPARSATLPYSSPARVKSPAASPTRPAPTSRAALGSRLSFSGSNKSSETIGAGLGPGPSEIGSVTGSVRKKGNRLSRLGDFMRRGQT